MFRRRLLTQTLPQYSLRQYVMYEAGGGKTTSSAVAASSQQPELARSGTASSAGKTDGKDVPSASRGPSRRRDSDWSTDTMAGPHLSGSDPRMFPGVLTREHRSGSSRNLAQADESTLPSRDAPNGHDG